MNEKQPADDSPALSVIERVFSDIDGLQAVMLNMPQVDLQTSHEVNGEVYARTIFIPAGTDLIGAPVLRDHINIVSGDIAVTTDQGARRITGDHVVFAAPAGHKRAGRAIADTYWTTICHTKQLEIAAIEDELTQEASLLQTRRQGIEFSPAAAMEA